MAPHIRRSTRQIDGAPPLARPIGRTDQALQSDRRRLENKSGTNRAPPRQKKRHQTLLRRTPPHARGCPATLTAMNTRTLPNRLSRFLPAVSILFSLSVVAALFLNHRIETRRSARWERIVSS